MRGGRGLSMKDDAFGLFGSNGLLARTETTLRRELAERPDDVAVLLKLALVQRRQGHLAAALATYQRIVALRLGHPFASWASAVLSGADTRRVPPPSGVVPVPFAKMPGFLTSEELAELWTLTLRQRGRFVPARVKRDEAPSSVEQEERRASVVNQEDCAAIMPWFQPKLLAAARTALAQLPVWDLDAGACEFHLNLTAHGNGDFFRLHRDRTEGNFARRRLSYVYYFHREPRRFDGGELLLYDTDRAAVRFELGVFTRLETMHNSLIFFPSDCYHEVLPVAGADDFADARFTVNGWLLVPPSDAAGTPDED